MKKNLLLIGSVLFGFAVNAQFTEANAPQIGDQTVLFMVDSLAPNFSGVTGDGVTWDYSGYGGYSNESRIISVGDAAQTAYVTDFPLSTHALDIEDMLLTFFTNDATGRVSQGFVFSDPNATVVATLDTDPQQMYTYPFDFGSAFTDTYEGQTEIMTQPTSILGNTNVSVDGRGTLKLALNEYADVLRYKAIDTGNINTFLGDLTLLRVQYEYYDHSQPDATGRLPIFVHSTITVTQANATTPLNEAFVVLSYDQPTSNVGLELNVLDQTNVYPNPATDVINVKLPSSVESVELMLTDALGRVVYSTKTNSLEETIDTSALNKGTYLLRITSNDNTATKSIVIK